MGNGGVSVPDLGRHWRATTRTMYQQLCTQYSILRRHAQTVQLCFCYSFDAAASRSRLAWLALQLLVCFGCFSRWLAKHSCTESSTPIKIETRSFRF